MGGWAEDVEGGLGGLQDPEALGAWWDKVDGWRGAGVARVDVAWWDVWAGTVAEVEGGAGEGCVGWVVEMGPGEGVVYRCDVGWRVRGR